VLTPSNRKRLLTIFVLRRRLRLLGKRYRQLSGFKTRQRDKKLQTIKMDLTPRQFEEYIFKLSGTPVLWRHKADELRHAANILRIEIDRWFKEANEHTEKVKAQGKEDVLIRQPIITSTYNMLLGFSIENLLKGIIIEKNPDHLVDGKLSNGIKKHDLFYLTNLAEYKLSDGEKKFCDTATEAMITSGRYPIAVKSADQRRILHLCDKDIFEALFQTLRKKIKWHLDTE
jgi:hypothetical protein